CTLRSRRLGRGHVTSAALRRLSTPARTGAGWGGRAVSPTAGLVLAGGREATCSTCAAGGQSVTARWSWPRAAAQVRVARSAVCGDQPRAVASSELRLASEDAVSG